MFNEIMHDSIKKHITKVSGYCDMINLILNHSMEISEKRNLLAETIHLAKLRGTDELYNEAVLTTLFAIKSELDFYKRITDAGKTKKPKNKGAR